MARSDEFEENDDKSTAGDGAQNGERRYTDLPVTLATTSETSRSRENDTTSFLNSNVRRKKQKTERSGDDSQSFGAKLWSNVKGIGKAAALVVGLLITAIYIIGSLNRENSLEKKQRDTINYKSAGPAVVVTPHEEKPEKTLPPLEPQTAIRLPTKDGKEQVIFVSKRLAEQFSFEAITEIEKNRQALLAEADKRIGESIIPTFDRMSQRARMFVEWYYSAEGEFSFDAALLSSAQENLMSATRSISLRDAISADMEVYTQKQFAKIVLRPQMTEEEIALSIDETAQALNNMHKLMLAKLQSRFQEIIIRSREINPSNFVDISISWEGLSQRFNGTGFNNSVVFDGAQMAKGAIAGFTIGKITSVIVGKLTKSLGITMTSRLSRAIPYIGMLIPVVIEAYNAYDKEEEKKALLSDLNGVIESIRRDIHKNVVKSVYQPMIDKLISQEMVLKEAMSGS